MHVYTCTLCKCTHAHMYVYASYSTRACTCARSSPLPPPQHPLWSQLIKDYQEQGLLVEGPLSNLRRNDMHLPKPSKLYNTRNPVSAQRPLCVAVSS